MHKICETHDHSKLAGLSVIAFASQFLPSQPSSSIVVQFQVYIKSNLARQVIAGPPGHMPQQMVLTISCKGQVNQVN